MEKKYICIREHGYPNPYGVYEVEIIRRVNGKRITNEYHVDEDRANKIANIIGHDRLSIEIEGGTIQLFASYPPQ